MARTIKLTNEAAAEAAKQINFENLMFGERADRAACWGLVLVVINNTPDEEELNKWWRSVTPDASWVTHAKLTAWCHSKRRELLQETN